MSDIVSVNKIDKNLRDIKEKMYSRDLYHIN